MLVDDEIRGKDVPKYLQNDIIDTVREHHGEVADGVSALKFGRHRRKLANGMIEKCRCKRGKIHGLCKIKKNGLIMSLVRYKHGKRNSSLTEFYDDGELRRVASYANGKKVGFEVIFDRRGHARAVIKHSGRFAKRRRAAKRGFIKVSDYVVNGQVLRLSKHQRYK